MQRIFGLSLYAKATSVSRRWVTSVDQFVLGVVGLKFAVVEKHENGLFCALVLCLCQQRVRRSAGGS